MISDVQSAAWVRSFTSVKVCVQIVDNLRGTREA
jgi:hypothetical protein